MFFTRSSILFEKIKIKFTYTLTCIEYKYLIKTIVLNTDRVSIVRLIYSKRKRLTSIYYQTTRV